MDEVFHLKAPFQPTGDQPQAIETLVKGVERGDRCQTLLGVTGSGKTFTMANVIARCNRPTLVLAHNKTLAAQLCTEFRSFFPDNAVEYFVSYYDYYQPKPTSQAPIPTLKRTAPSTMRSTACATRPRRRFRSGGMSSLWHRCPVSTLWVTPSITAAWSSACGPGCRWSGMTCAKSWSPCNMSGTTSILSAISSVFTATRWISIWPT